jgi:uncharacterized repeat protein (TIGR03806 family)
MKLPPRATRALRIGLVSALLALSGAAELRAQTCTTGPRVPFAGHNFPLDSLPEPGDVEAVSVHQGVSLSEPTFLIGTPDSTGRKLALERFGRIRVVPASGTNTPVFLDLSGDVSSSGPEQGLLGLAFDPDFATNRRFYVNYTATGARCREGMFCTKVESFRQSASDPNQVESGSRFEILQFPRFGNGHNGGMLAFGPDRMLYISSGDDFPENAQDLSKLTGKILRIDPNGGSPYAIPASNPFVGQSGRRGEIWAYGFRNPWRLSFDRVTGDLWIGDVGEGAWEEIDFVAAGSTSFNRNFGWPICEGNHDYDGGNCAALSSTRPVAEYPHDTGTGGFAVTGGYVYRGQNMPGLFGTYLYADWGTGRLWGRQGPTGPSTVLGLLDTQGGLTSFGQDAQGELYYVTISGGIFQFQDNSQGGGSQFPTTLSGTGLFSNVATLTPAPGLVEYDVNSPLWSDRALKRRWLALPAGTRIGFSADGDWNFPIGTVFVKHFELQTSATARTRVETRVLLRQIDRWVGYTYRWNSAQNEASLVTSEESGNYSVWVNGTPTAQTWVFPSPAGCLSCHTSAAGRVLGVRSAQLNRNFSYPSGSDNQLHAWSSCLSLFNEKLESASVYPAYADPANTNETLTARARSYLAVNCAHCHQPLAPAPGGLDLRYRVLLGGMNVIGVTPSEGSLGLPNAQRVRVGSKAQSVLWARVGSTDPNIHMPVGSYVPDPLAVSLLGSWIDTGLATIDSDGDGDPDPADNCDYEANASQTDGGGWLTTSPDGIGDACQCLDVTPAGQISASDVARLRTYLTGNNTLVTPGVERRSNNPEAAGRASIVDVVKLRRSMAGLAPAPPQTCPAATALFP